jgi:SAM-dependent methyltransferase
VSAAAGNAPVGPSADTAFTTDDFADLYPPGIEHHYWTAARNRLIASRIRTLLGADASQSGAVLDVGCGTGVVAGHLRRVDIDCIGCDLAHSRARSDALAPFLHFGISATDLPVELRAPVRLLLLLDVLEHVPDPQTLLAALHPAFPNVRAILVTLPARMELWSNYDVRNRHVRRYDETTVQALAVPEKWSLTDTRYFFHGLYPVARALLASGARRNEAIHAPGTALARLVHGAVASAFVLEARLLPASLPGSSLMATFTRR